jgi:hypothetical protein
MQVLPNGIGLPETGHILLGRQALQVTGNVWFVDYASGTDAASPRGLSSEYQLKTLGQAVTNAAAGDIIVLRSTHEETIAAELVISKRLTIIGEGRTGSAPSATLINGITDAPGDSMISLGTTCRIINVRMVNLASTDTSPHLEIGSVSVNSQILFCQFEAGTGMVTYTTVLIDGTHSVFEDCVFKSTSIYPENPPESLVSVPDATTVAIFNRCTFDGGETGFASKYAVDFSPGAINNLYMEDVSLLNGADAGLASGTVAILHNVSTGPARVEWL